MRTLTRQDSALSLALTRLSSGSQAKDSRSGPNDRRPQQVTIDEEQRSRDRVIVTASGPLR